jgi:hypothetical protein
MTPTPAIATADVRDARVVQRDDERAGCDRGEHRDREPGASDGAECAHEPSALRDGDVGDEADDGEERAPGELRRDADGKLTLEDPCGRPRDRGERDERASPPHLRAERQGRCRRCHSRH